MAPLPVSKFKAKTPESRSRRGKTQRTQNMNVPGSAEEIADCKDHLTQTGEKLKISELPLLCAGLDQPRSYSRDLERKLLAYVREDIISTSSKTETFQKQRPKRTCTTQSWENEDLYHEVKQLVLICRSYPRGHKPPIRESWHHQVVEEIGLLINIKDLFGPGPHTVILHGDAGVGKSTLARQVRRAWEEGQQYRDRFQHVFYFNCGQLSLANTMRFSELTTEVGAAPEAAIGQILSQPEKLLFILDGFDEPEWDLVKQKYYLHQQLSWNQSLWSLLSQLLKKNIFPMASLLVTARTRALEKFIPYLEHPQWVEVLGFSESGRKDYFRKYFTDEDQARRALSLAESNRALWAMCLMPWVSWLVCTCLRQQMEQGRELSLRPQTTTALCLQYLSQALPAEPLGTQLRGLCSLAAEGIWQRKILFKTTYLRKHGVKDTVISTLLQMGILRQHPAAQRYSFIHLCFQQFFVAMSCVLECSKEKGGHPKTTENLRKQLIEHCGHDVFGAPIMHFVLGLLGEQGMREMERIFNCTLSWERRQELLDWTQEEAWHQYFSPESCSPQLFRCLYEIQDKNFLKQALSLFYVKSVCVKTDMDLLVFTFCIKFCRRVQSLQLNLGGQDKKKWKPPRLFLFTCFPITDACWQILFSVPGITGSLTELDLTGNFLSPSAVQSLCEALRCPHCTLETLRLVRCGLTSSSCQDLASALSTSPRLTELAMQQNDLGDLGVRLLCEGLRQPACRIRTLGLDPAWLSEEVIGVLRALQKEKTQPYIYGRRRPSVTTPEENPREEDMSDNTPTLEQQRPESEGSTSQVAEVEPTCLSSLASLGDLHMEPLRTKDEFWDPTEHVVIEVTDHERSLYRVHFPTAGSYHWPNTDLQFVVRGSVTIEIEFCSWDPFLDMIVPQDNWMVAGPLLDIKAEPGAVAAVYLPHFVSLKGDNVDTSQFHVAHFKEEGMLLEEPARVEACYTVLENPSFSPMGVLLRIFPVTRNFIPITSTVLLYHQLRPEEINFHLYLIPNDCSIQKAIDDKEKQFQFVQIHKPPPLTPLYIGSRFTVSGSEEMEIMPQELELCYRSPGKSQLFSEISLGQSESGILLQLINQKDGTVVWEALVRPGDLRPVAALDPPAPPDAPRSAHFLDRYRVQLVARVTSVDPILDRLHGQVLSEEQYETIRAEATPQGQMRKLFSFSRSWDQACKDLLYQALKDTQPYLIMDLWEKGNIGGH